jgi:type II secretory pathway pseudopilin PulG
MALAEWTRDAFVGDTTTTTDFSSWSEQMFAPQHVGSANRWDDRVNESSPTFEASDATAFDRIGGGALPPDESHHPTRPDSARPARPRPDRLKRASTLIRLLGRHRGHGEAGFTILESAIAMSVIFGVLLGLLATLTTGVRGVVAGRQRTGATAMANQVLEQAKAQTYEQVGHWLADTTLAADANISGTSPNYVFDGEPLVASTIPSTHEPFAPHTARLTQDGVTYTRSVYVTQVSPASGDPYKRVTVKVSWANAQYHASAIPNNVTLTTLMFNASPPPDPLLEGVVDADSGRLTVTGLLAGVNLNDLSIWLPFAHAAIDSSFIKRANGFAWAPRAQLNLTAGSASGCAVSSDGLSADCGGTKAETVADNDGGTAPPDNDSLGPAFDFGGSVSAGTALSANLGSGSSSGASTARSCFSCFGPDIGDDDSLAFHTSTATGPASGSVPFAAGNVSGSLASGTGASCTLDCATATVDVDRVGTDPRITSTATTATPALDLLTLSGAPAGYAGMVRIAPTTASTTAYAGPGAPAPTVSGSAFTVQLYETSGSPGYRNETITPGNAASPAPAHAELTFGIDTVVMDATVLARPASTASTSGGGARTHAEAALTNWLTITVRLQVIRLGTPLADLNVEFDYGRVSAATDYAAAP